MTLINVHTARAAAYDAVALSGFYKGGDAWGDFGGGRVANTLCFPLGSENPNLSMAYPPTSTIFNDESGVVQSTWADTGSAWTGSDWVNRDRRSVFKPGLDAVSSVLMRRSIINEFNIAEIYAGATDWVITMPTKNLYFDRDNNSLKPRKLFQSEFRKGGAADDVQAHYYDRETRPLAPTADFCIPAPRPSSSLSWVINVVWFRTPQAGRTVFHSTNSYSWTTSGCEEGWAQTDIKSVYPPLYDAHTLTADAPSGRKLTGLPIVGFAATLYNNATVDGGSLGRVWASYVGTVPHRYERNIQ